jgi:hypothetical protein
MLAASVLALAGVLSGLLAIHGSDGTGPTNADLRLESTARTRLTVGEFLAVRTVVTVRQHVRLCDRDVLIEVDTGRGFVGHAEAFEGWSCSAPSDLAPGRSFVAETAVGLEALEPGTPSDDWVADLHASARLVFDHAGIYRIRARHGDAVSNVIVVEAVMPTGEDARLLAALRARPAILSFYAGAEELVRVQGERLLAEFGPRPLLQPFVRQMQPAAGSR